MSIKLQAINTAELQLWTAELEPSPTNFSAAQQRSAHITYKCLATLARGTVQPSERDESMDMCSALRLLLETAP